MEISVRKIFALLLTWVMCVGLTGCGKDEIRIEGSLSEEVAETATSAVVNNTEINWAEPVSEDTAFVPGGGRPDMEIYPYAPEEEFDIFPYFTQAVICDMENPSDYISHLWNDTVPVEGYFIDSNGNVTNLEGETSWEFSGVTDEAMLRFGSLEAADFYQTCYVKDYVVDNGTLYRYGKDLLLVWNPPADRQDDTRLQGVEYDTDTYYLATVFYKLWEDSCPINLDINDPIIWDGVKYTRSAWAGYWIDVDDSVHEYFNSEKDTDSAVIADAMARFYDLEYIGAFRSRFTSNGLVYENRMYRNGDELIILYKLYAAQTTFDGVINMYNYSIVERWVQVND